MKVTVRCEHGVSVEVTGADDPVRNIQPEYGVRVWLREILLACPRCRFDADGFMPAGSREPGP